MILFKNGNNMENRKFEITYEVKNGLIESQFINGDSECVTYFIKYAYALGVSLLDVIEYLPDGNTDEMPCCQWGG